MKRRTHHMLAMVLSTGLILVGTNATAATLENPTLILKYQDSATFSHNTGPSAFNDPLSSALSIRDSNSLLVTDSVGPSFDTQRDNSIQRVGKTDGQTRDLNIGIREIGREGEHHFHEEGMMNPVPEPAEYMLITVGLCLLGFFAYRRRHEQGFTAA